MKPVVPSHADPADIDLLISHLAGPLAPDMRPAFRRAAEQALAQLPCPGEGSIYRLLAPLWRSYFDPPSDWRASWDISQESRASKLRSAPAIGYGRMRDSTRRLKAVG
jgi:hypothetical protein